MTKLPILSGDKVVKAFSKAGWVKNRQKGSHIIMTKIESDIILSIPVHKNKTVKRGTLNALIKDAGLSIDEFIELL